MAKSVQSFLDDVHAYTKTIDGGDVDDSDIVRYLNDFFKWSRRRYLLPWSRRTTELLVFPGVYSYASPSDMVAPIKPQKFLSDDTSDDTYFLSQSQPDFARNRNDRNDFAVNWEQTTKLLNIRYAGDAGEVVAHTMDDIATNGTWVVAGDGSGLAADTGIKLNGAGSLRFNVTSSSSLVTLTNDSITALDLQSSTSTVTNPDFQFNSYVFFALYLPVTGLTSIALRWGSSSGNYWSQSATTSYDGSAFRVGWNIIGLSWLTATETGTVDESAVNYLQARLTGAATGNNYRIDQISFKKFTQLNFPYYSRNLVQSTATIAPDKEFVTATATDYIAGDEDFIDCATKYTVREIAKYELKNGDLFKFADTDLEEAVRNLSTRYPNLEAVPQTQWFNMSLLRG